MKIMFYKIFVIAVLLFVDSGLSQYMVSNSTISSGSLTATTVNYSVYNCLCEPIIGTSATANNFNYCGFWYVYQQSTITGIDDEELLPTVYKLEQNYPNPFNPSTKIKFAVPERSNVLIKVYDILGSEVSTLVNEEMEAGWYQKNFNAQSLASGVYLFRMEAGNYIDTKKMILLR